VRTAFGLLFVGLGVFGLAFLGVLPARTYFGQQDELVQKKARLVMLGERNSLLGNRVASLQSDQVVARIARDQFGMVAPGDTLTVLPGLRDESLSLNGDGSSVVAAVPPANVAGDPALLSSLLNWIRVIVS
jgi:cell division protein FtsB